MANSNEMIRVRTTHNAHHFSPVLQAVQPFFANPQPGQVAELTLTDGDRSVHLRVDTRAAAHGNQQQLQQGEAAEQLRDFYVDMSFVPSAEVKGLDFGRYAQATYHVFTFGLGTSVSKCAIFLLNTREDVQHLARNWPPDVQMRDLEEKVLRRALGYVFCRKKIQKEAVTFYLNYVKKEGSETRRLDHWLHLVSAIGTQANVTDWAKVISAAMGGAANLALGF